MKKIFWYKKSAYSVFYIHTGSQKCGEVKKGFVTPLDYCAWELKCYLFFNVRSARVFKLISNALLVIVASKTINCSMIY